MESDSFRCYSYGSIKIKTFSFIPGITGGTWVFGGDSTLAIATGGNKYQWYGPGIKNGSKDSIYLKPDTTAMYYVSIADTLRGCSGTDSVLVRWAPKPHIVADIDSLCNGGSAGLSVVNGAADYWIANKSLWNFTSSSALAKPDKTTTYFAYLSSDRYHPGYLDSITIYVTDCVWPGDASDNLVADYRDALDLGLGYGKQGHARKPGTINWQPYTGFDWTDSLPNRVNFKHFDCNGDGVINAADTAIISRNYIMSYPPPHSGKAGDPPFFIQFDKDTFYAGDTATAMVYAGAADNFINHAYGLACRIGYAGDNCINQPPDIAPVCGFFCTGTELNYFHNTLKDSMLDAASVQTSHKTVNTSFGQLYQLKFILKDTLSYTYPANGRWLYANLLNDTAIDINGNPIAIFGSDGKALVLPRRKNVVKADFVSNRTGCEDINVRFKCLATDSGGGIVNYDWDFGDGSPHSTLANPVHKYKLTNDSEVQSFDVSLKVADNYGYTAQITKTRWIVILASPVPVIEAQPDIATLDDPTFHFDIGDQSRNFDTSLAGNTYSWYFGDPANADSGGRSFLKTPEYTYGDTGTYQVVLKVTNNLGCTGADTENHLFIIKQGFAIYIPNVFTPNGQAKNEVFKPVVRSIASYQMLIFNRWAQLVFSTGDAEKGWDGNYRGSPEPEGVYVYKIKVKNLAGKEFNYQGNITLLR